MRHSKRMLIFEYPYAHVQPVLTSKTHTYSFIVLFFLAVILYLHAPTSVGKSMYKSVATSSRRNANMVKLYRIHNLGKDKVK